MAQGGFFLAISLSLLGRISWGQEQGMCPPVKGDLFDDFVVPYFDQFVS